MERLINEETMYMKEIDTLVGNLIVDNAEKTYSCLEACGS